MELMPLDAGEIDRANARKSADETSWKRIPIIGWIIADGMWLRRNRPARAALFRQLESRPAETLDAWGTEPEYRRFAAEICEIARKEMGWPNERFVPQDPYRVVFWSFDDGLDLEAAMMEIEDRFDIEVLTDPDVQRWAEGDLGAFVEELYNRLCSGPKARRKSQG